MPQSTASPEILAHWQYQPELWRDFVEYESGRYKKSVRSAKYLIAGTIISAIVLISLLSVIPLIVTKKFDSSIWGPALGITLIAGIFLAAGFIMLAMRREKIARLNTKTGEAVIALNRISLNGVDFDWGYGGSGWQLVAAERKMVAVNPLKKIEVLELRFITVIPGKNTTHREEGDWRIPVQMGRESEADRIIERLRAELSSINQALPIK
jgi:hypothetical protein